ncbi:uncharacterized protein [Physcomitrium patens]|uniref:uncharacterized protein isoform X2 n=1 Tax=Physcomitrium patens TaxID=3218 RepID=UPI000D175098|nr:protein arginine methyltransferase NDUFAF7, mitochondrial-like isoform X2 [Physcomitrium patens]|eukprot:XP_024382737.1 protein arginine methyltransferase NDUFAF7, mitochondrial-like isoform X2 [Physcomitrella patens]
MASRLFLRSALSLRRASRCASSSSSSSFRFVSSSGFCSSSGTPGFHPLPVSDAAVGIEQPAPESSLVVDRSGLFNTPEHSHGPGPSEETPMAKHLKALIRFRGGPITVAEYMEEVLTNPNAGFYMNRDVFGTHGDFVTSPDISQMFGEMVGVWSMCLWHQMGQPEAVNIIELGPGRGTLMADLLRGTAKFKDFSQTLSVHLVECSPALRKIQHETLKCVYKGGAEEKPTADGQNSEVVDDRISQISGVPVAWHFDLDQVPRGVPTIIIAHEFYDALPIHQFQKSPRGWCEKLVDVAEDDCQGLRFVLSPGPTAASKLFLTRRMKWASLQEKAEIEHVEVCPQAMKVTADIAKRVGGDGGGALIVDYGDSKIVSDSLQAIKKHEFVHVLDSPGNADLSAYVDFAALKHVVEDAAAVYGPITQSQFLGALGINFRLESLVQNATDEQAEALQLGYWRLVGDGPAPWLDSDDDVNRVPPGMGSRYKALVVVNDKYGAPVGFQ